MTAAATLEYLTTNQEYGHKIKQLSLREIRILADESLTEGFEEMVVGIVRRLAAMALEDEPITTELFIAVASAELEV
mgnify:FL=1